MYLCSLDFTSLISSICGNFKNNSLVDCLVDNMIYVDCRFTMASWLSFNPLWKGTHMNLICLEVLEIIVWMSITIFVQIRSYDNIICTYNLVRLNSIIIILLMAVS